MTKQLAQLLSVSQNAMISVEISHRGRGRLAELEQQLKAARDRDDTGLLWAKRHVLVDLAIAILSAHKDAPLSVAFLDMNGLTGIKNTHAFVRELGKDALNFTEGSLRLTASCGGVSTTNPNDDAAELLKRADKVLYKAKPASGPGKVCVGRCSAWAEGDGEVTKYTPGTEPAQ